MQKTLIAAAVGTLLTASGNTFASSTDDRLAALEKRLAYLEQRVKSQDAVITEKNEQLAKLGGGEAGGWFQSVEIGGVVEVEAAHTDDGTSDSTDIAVPTVELGVAAQINDWVSAEVVALYEDDGTHSGQFDIDTAMISIADPDNIWFANAGQYVIPFGIYDTQMISDPITLDLGETGDVAAEFGIAQGGMSASIYTFNGNQPATDGASWGIAAGYEGEASGAEFAINFGYINDLTQSDAIVDDNNALTDEVGAFVVSAAVTMGNITVIGEYLTANQVIAGYSEEPSAFNVEAGYGFEIAGMPAMVALGYQGTEDAAASAGGLPEERILGALSVEIMDGTSVAVEYAVEEDYAGVETDTVTGLVAVEF